MEAWLWRIVVNAASEHGRHLDEVPDPEAGAKAARNGTFEEQSDARIPVALALLPERQRLALFLRYYADLDYRTIAETLDIAIGTVGVTLSTARTKLRELLEEVPQ